MNRQNKDSDKDLELNSNVHRAIRTTFIGAISQFEKSFGYLWGHGKDKSEITENQKKFLDLWLQTRNNILDFGNAQSRIIDREFEKFIVKYNGYQYKFQVKPRVNRKEDGNGNL